MLLIKIKLQQLKLNWLCNSRSFFFKHFKPFKPASFFLHASELLCDVIMLLYGIINTFDTRVLHMMIFFKTCKIFTKSVCLKTNL